MTTQMGISFAQRFIDRYAGQLVTDPRIALVELVANAWDAGATFVEISWPDSTTGQVFRISDNGQGMTEEEFRSHFCSLDYDREKSQGNVVLGPPGADLNRTAFGQNGRGRLAGFYFSDPFRVRTSSAGESLVPRFARCRGFTLGSEFGEGAVARAQPRHHG